MKPLAAGSVVGLDPRLKSDTNPENSRFMLFNSTPGSRAILPAAVAELAKALNQLPDESLPQAAMRYVYSKPFLSCDDDRDGRRAVPDGQLRGPARVTIK